MSNLEDNKYTISGKKVLIFFILGLIACSSALFFGFITKMDPNERDTFVKQVTEKEYASATLQADKYTAEHDYVKAIVILQKFLKRFSYNNQYKDIVEKQIEELKQQAKKEMQKNEER